MLQLHNWITLILEQPYSNNFNNAMTDLMWSQITNFSTLIDCLKQK